MNRKEAKRLIYLELALTLKADIQDKGSWMYHGNVDWSDKDKEVLIDFAKELSEEYLQLSGMEGK
jgi:hypothetical protein